MNTLLIYYSFSGKTAALAQKLAAEEGADLLALQEASHRSKLNAFLSGSRQARGQRQAALRPFSVALAAYDKIIIAMPIWAGFPAPAINNIIELLPQGKEIELVITSGSGSSKGSAEKTKALVEAKGCHVSKYLDIKTG